MKMPSIQSTIKQWKASSHFVQLVNLTGADLATAVTKYLTLAERVVHIISTTGGGNFTIYLPPVAEAAGLIFSVYFISKGDNETVAISDLDDSLDFNSGDSDYSMTAAKDKLVLYSDGFSWAELYNDIGG